MESKVLKQLPSDWANLPTELLAIISEKATTANLQYQHLRMVCKPWRAALTPDPRHVPLSPWLLMHRTNVDDHCHLSFYNISKSTTRQMELPNVSGMSIYGSYYGWIVLVREERVSLRNPINGRSIDLPSLDAPPTNLIPAVARGESSVSPLNKYCVRKVVLSCNPSMPDCTIVVWVVSPSDWELGFCRIGDTYWTGLRKEEKGRSLLDFTCGGNNLVYAVNKRREVLSYDLTSLAVTTFPSKINYNGVHDRINMVEADARSDRPLIVITTEYLGQTNRIYVYEWIHSMKRWRRIKNIGESALFLHHDNCFQVQLEGRGQNEIYYGITHSVSTEAYRVSIKKADLKTGRVVPHSPSPTEIFPGMYGSPIWFSPCSI